MVTTEPSAPLIKGQILVVEDEAEIRDLISLILLRAGHAVVQCGSTIEAEALLRSQRFDLIILDWMLPGPSGVDFLKNSKNLTQPVLMLTAKSAPEDIVAGLEAGADDYITKPFEPAILSARVKSLLRRAQKSTEPVNTDILKNGPVILNLTSHEVTLKGEKFHVTLSEFKILVVMMTHQGKVMTREQLVSIVQGDGISVTSRTIDTHVFGLRKKLGEDADWIETIRGVGYRVRLD